MGTAESVRSQSDYEHDRATQWMVQKCVHHGKSVGRKGNRYTYVVALIFL